MLPNDNTSQIQATMEVLRSKEKLAQALAKVPAAKVTNMDRVDFIHRPSQIPYCRDRLRKAVIIGLDTVRRVR
jgi:hypothetical protein